MPDKFSVSQLQEYEFTYEERANKGFIKYFFIAFLIVAAMWILTAVGLFDINYRVMTISCAISGVLFIAPVVFRKYLPYTSNYLKYVLLFIISVSSTVLVGTLTMHTYLLYILPMLCSVQYRSKRVLWYTYAMTCINLVWGSLMGFYFGLCDLNLFLVSNHTRSWYMEHVVNGTLYLPLNENPLLVILLYQDVPYFIFFLFFAFILRHTVLQGYMDLNEIKRLTDKNGIDEFTGLLNKNRYESMVKDYYSTVDTVGVIFWDVNGLKKTNDSLGHDAGDQLIVSVARCIKGSVNGSRPAFRVGGDEFVMIVENPLMDSMEKIIDDVNKRIESLNANRENPISVAAGWAVAEGYNIEKTIKRADAQMYLYKRAMKNQRQF